MESNYRKIVLILLAGIYSIAVKSQESYSHVQRDSVMNIFSYIPKALTMEKGTSKDCYSDLNFIEATFNGEHLINGKAIIMDCNLTVLSGTISTGIQSLINDQETMILYYYLITFNKSNSWIKKYYEKLSGIEYDRISPMMEEPYTCYNFLLDNNRN